MFEGIFSPTLAAVNPTVAPQQKLQPLNAPAPSKTAGPDNTPKYPGEPWMEPGFHDAIVFQESKGDPKARGDFKDGVYRAQGLYQMRPDFVQNANDTLAKWRRGQGNTPQLTKEFKELAEKYKDAPLFKPEDRDNPDVARMIYRINNESLQRQFLQKFGRMPTDSERASMYHLGKLEGIDKDTQYRTTFAKSQEEVKKKK